MPRANGRLSSRGTSASPRLALFCFTGKLASAPSDFMNFYRARAGHKFAVRSGHIAGRDPMRTDLEPRCVPGCPTLGIDLDRFSHVRAIDGELNRPARKASRHKIRCDEGGEGDQFSRLRNIGV